MKTTTIEADGKKCCVCENMSAENKLQFNRVSPAVKQSAADIRSLQLKKIIQEINNDPGISDLNPDILLALLQNDDY